MIQFDPPGRRALPNPHLSLILNPLPSPSRLFALHISPEAPTSVGTRSAASTTPTERGPTEPSTSAGMNPALHHRASFNLQNECGAALAAAKTHAWEGRLSQVSEALRKGDPNRPCSKPNRSFILISILSLPPPASTRLKFPPRPRWNAALQKIQNPTLKPL